ncbi:MraY family glycosyltransferase [Methylibium sp.]|uniref:MraY family glycosyltransferase n=1 Tax=Methylibium sp. TaxID=2067992 RepID=UPI003D105743
MLLFLCVFAASAALTLLVVRSGRKHFRFSADHDLSGPQKFHARPVPRVGGIGIVGGLALGTALLWWLRGDAVGQYAALLLLCGVPAFGAGLAEDLTKRVSAAWRLVATALAALLAVLLLDASITRTDLWGLDWVASFTAGAAFLAVFAVAGIANAVNIIDGFNGLASMCVMMMLLAITYVANQVGDSTIALLGLAGAGAVLGFFVWNYPAGLIFLGDGGAYFLGFYLSELSILLLHRNPQVSPLFPLLMAIYPVFETLFSMYRRRVVRGRAMGIPDGVHLHSLIYRRLLRWAVGNRDAAALTRRNSMTAPYLWLLCMLAVAPSVLFWDDSRVLGSFILLFGLSYTVLYGMIVRFKAPRWLVLRR